VFYAELRNGVQIGNYLLNPSKTEILLFTRKYKPDILNPILFYGKELVLSTQVKDLGVVLDPKLNWKLHKNSAHWPL